MNVTSYPFYSAYNHLNDFYGIVLNEDEFETIALFGWMHIGNKRTKYYKHTADTIDYQLMLPCNVDIIESVHGNMSDFTMTDNVRRESYGRQQVESYIESRKTGKNPLYQSGKLLDYHQEGNILVFDGNHKSVTVVYKGVIADEQGLPTLNYKETEALSTYCAYTYYYKKALQTKDGSTMQLAKDLLQTWQRKCTQARTPERINQNEMDDILDIAASWDRKRFGISYKPMRK